MDQAKLVACLKKVRAHPADTPCPLNVEEAGILKAFIKARMHQEVSDAERSLLLKIAKILSTWAPPAATEVDASTGEKERRTQLVLREAIDKILQERWNTLTADDTELVRSTHEVYKKQSARSTIGNPRLLAVLDRAIKKLDAKLETDPASVPTLVSSPDNCTVFEQTTNLDDEDHFAHHLDAGVDLSGGNITPVSMLDEIEVNLHVRMFEFEGNTKIRGDIAQDVLLRITEGDVRVDGQMMGHVIASGTVQIDGNVQGGTVISSKGDIIADQVLVGTSLIAQAGDIVCNHMEGAKRIFAWGTLQVSRSILGGRAVAGGIEVQERVHSATLETSGSLKAERLEVGSQGPTVVCLRERITCEDYGRSMDEKERERVYQTHLLENEITALEEAHHSTSRMMHNCYRTGLFYLMAGVDSAVGAMDLQGLQMKSTMLRQVIATAEGVRQFYEELNRDTSSLDLDEVNSYSENQRETLLGIQKSMENVPDEFGITHRRAVLDRCSQGLDILQELYNAYQQEESAAYLEGPYTKTVSDWRADQGDAKRSIKAHLDSFKIDEKLLARIEERPDDLASMLDKELKLKLSSPNQDDVRRGKSPLIRLLKDSAARYAKGIQQSLEISDEKKRDLDDVRVKLEESSTVLFSGSNDEDSQLMAMQYDSGVVVTADPNMTEGFDTDIAEVIVLADALDTETLFRRRGRAIERVEQ